MYLARRPSGRDRRPRPGCTVRLRPSRRRYRSGRTRSRRRRRPWPPARCPRGPGPPCAVLFLERVGQIGGTRRSERRQQALLLELDFIEDLVVPEEAAPRSRLSGDDVVCQPDGPGALDVELGQDLHARPSGTGAGHRLAEFPILRPSTRPHSLARRHPTHPASRCNRPAWPARSPAPPGLRSRSSSPVSSATATIRPFRESMPKQAYLEQASDDPAATPGRYPEETLTSVS